jgi:hypothetical protein
MTLYLLFEQLDSGAMTLRGDATNDSMREPVTDLPAPNVTPTFIFGVCRQVSWTINRVMLDSGGASEGCTILTAGVTPSISMFDGTTVNGNAGATVGTLVRFFASYTGSTSDGLKFGSAAETTGASAGTTNPGTGIRLFAAFDDTAPGNYDLTVVCYFSARPSAGELTNMATVVATRYGATT